MKHRSLAALTLLLPLSLLLPAALAASSASGPLEHRSQRIVVVPDQDLEVEIWTDKGPRARYCVGEPIEIFFRTTRDAYVAIFDEDTRGDIHRIFPNRYDHEHFAEAGRTYRLPVDGYRLLVEGPPGRETLKAVAATDRQALRRASRKILRGYDPRPASLGAGSRDSGSHGHEAYPAAPIGPRDHEGDYDELHHADVRAVTVSSSGPRSHRQRIVVVPDEGPEVAFDSISHRVKSGRACHRLPRYRPWWR